MVDKVKELEKKVDEVYHESRNELDRAIKLQKPILLRDACEKAWLAVVEAANLLFAKKGIHEAISHSDRREKLWKLEQEDPKLRELGIYDRVNARAFTLHIQGFYEGSVHEDSLSIELDKVRKLVEDIKAL